MDCAELLIGRLHSSSSKSGWLEENGPVGSITGSKFGVDLGPPDSTELPVLDASGGGCTKSPKSAKSWLPLTPPILNEGRGDTGGGKKVVVVVVDDKDQMSLLLVKVSDAERFSWPVVVSLAELLKAAIRPSDDVFRRSEKLISI